jgi:hypothetical protein
MWSGMAGEIGGVAPEWNGGPFFFPLDGGRIRRLVSVSELAAVG